MAGQIYPAARHRVCTCGGKFKQTHDPEYKRAVPRCENCNRAPKKLRVQISMPTLGKKDLYYNVHGTPLTTLALADAFIDDIHSQIEKRTLDPALYASPKQRQRYRVSEFAKKVLTDREKHRGQKRGCSPSYLDDAWKLYRNHIVPAFGDLDVQEVRHVHLHEFLHNGAGGERQRHNALNWMRVFLDEARIHFPNMVMPKFPKIPKAKRTTRRLSRDQQMNVLAHATCHVEALLLCVVYPIRPCEVRALQWRDIDFRNRTITIQRHFSGKQVLPGRKSQMEGHDPYAKLELHLVDQVIEALKRLDQGVGETWVFVKKHTTRKRTPLGETSLRYAWNLACESAGLERIPMYVGTKHSTMTHLAQKMDISLADLREIAGHTDQRSTERYAKRSSRAISSTLEL